MQTDVGDSFLEVWHVVFAALCGELYSEVSMPTPPRDSGIYMLIRSCNADGRMNVFSFKLFENTVNYESNFSK